MMKKLLELTACFALLALNVSSGTAADTPADSAAMIQLIKNDADPATVLQQIKNTVFSKGPNGETCDLGANIAIDMAQDGFAKGTGSQWPVRQAETEAILAGYGPIGKTAPAYVGLPAVPVTKENILPDVVKKALQ